MGGDERPGKDAGSSRDSLPPASRTFRIEENVGGASAGTKTEWAQTFSLSWGYDDPEKLRSSNRQFGPIGADAGQPKISF